MLGNVLVNLLGILIFLFLFWKRLKEDYDSERIFSTAFISLTGGYLGYLISSRFFPAFTFFFFFISLMIGLFVAVKKYKLRFFESFESLIFALLPYYSFLFLKDSIGANNISSLFGFLVVIGLVGLFLVLDSKYKTFSWYKSGKVGFAGLALTGIFFLLRAITSIFVEGIYTFSGNMETLLSSVFSFFMFLLLFNLSRK